MASNYELTWPKECAICHTQHDQEAWEALDYLGTMPVDEEGVSLELRMCSCGNDLSQPMTMKVLDVK